MGWVISPGSPGWNKHSGALEGLRRDQSCDCFVMSDHEVESLFDGWRSTASRSPGQFLIDVFYEIPRSCLEYGMRVNGWKEIWLIHSMVGWNVVVPYQVGFCIINMRLFLLFISWVLYWFICGFYGYCILGICFVIILVMNMYYDSGYVWLPSCFYLYMNE